ncbi:ubiquitin-like domain-containing CTD phosphatase 1, partial [Physeter macrocephalus]|uniref:Ubiquitin-like domain-containing CTD phosphatase 1 n=1 Tax=Physeter macrocephalus TaxID=9755 RepID=A0A455BH75_PHYMC
MSLTDSVVDDFAGTAAAPTADGDELRTPLHLQRLEKAVAATHVQLLHPPREGKKLLVLDLDYTLFDCKTLAGSMDDLKRPFLNEFME